MAANDEVQIRFSVIEDKTVAPAAAATSSKSASPAEARPQDLSQGERDRERHQEKTHESHSLLSRYEHRMEHRLKHIGARLIAAQLVEEGSDILGIGGSFPARLGEHALEGFMMGGPVGAAARASMAIVHQLAEIVKGHSESLKKLAEKQKEAEEKAKEEAIDLRIETGVRAREEADKLREEIAQFNERIRDATLNAARYMNVPYLGRG